MPNVNYANPESFYPLQTTDPRSQAFGAGTVPGSFLSGMMLPERMNDYRNVRDVSLESSKLGNLRNEAELQTYREDAPLRDIERRTKIGEQQNVLALQPGNLSTGARKQVREYTEEGRLLNQALLGMDADKRQAITGELINAATVLQMFKDENGNLRQDFDPRIISQEMKKMGINIDPQFIPGLGRLNAEDLKQMNEMAQITHKEAQITGRNYEDNETLLELERMRSGRGSAAGAKVARDNALDERAEAAFKRRYKKNNPQASEQDVQDAADLWIFQNRTRDPYYSQGAAGDKQAAELQRLRESLQNPDQPVAPGPNEAPQVRSKTGGKELMTIPEVGEVEVISREGNRVRIYDPKTGKFGWWEP